MGEELICQLKASSRRCRGTSGRLHNPKPPKGRKGAAGSGESNQAIVARPLGAEVLESCDSPADLEEEEGNRPVNLGNPTAADDNCPGTGCAEGGGPPSWGP
mgnify:CR=1 FL=1